MRLLIIGLVLFSSSSLSDSAVEDFYQKTESLNIERYAPEKKYMDSAKNGFESRRGLQESERKTVSEINENINSREFQEQQSKFRAQISTALGADIWKSDSDMGDEDQGSFIPYSQKPIVFISSSVPMRTLRNYAFDLEKVGGIMVLRGFIGGMNKVKPTLSFIKEILKVDKSCSNEPCKQRNVPVLIDPIIFREYGVSEVPAFAIHGLTNLQKYCKGTSGLNPGSAIVYGDSSVKYLANKLYQETGDSEHKRILEGIN